MLAKRLRRVTWPPQPDEVEAMLRSYKAMVSNIAQGFFIRGADRDDVLQEGMIGLWKAIRDFKPKSGRSFDAFAKLCVRRQIITALKAAMRPKHRLLTDCVSLETPILEECTLGETIADNSSPGVLESVIEREGLVRLFGGDGHMLSSFESKVAKLYSQGYSYTEIAKKLGCTTKSVDCAVFRVKRKLRAQAVAEAV